MNSTAFDAMLKVIDDAISLADDAVKTAEVSAQHKPEPVTLVKVAAARCNQVAKELIKTGAFREQTGSALAKSLEEAGTSDLLDLLEKLASRAVFPLSVDSVGRDGDLVDKPESRAAIQPANSRVELWARCCEEAGLS